MYILLFLLVIVIVVIVLGLSIVGAVLRAVFGLGRRSSHSGKTTQQQTYGRRTYQQPYQSEQDNSSYTHEENLSQESRPRQKKKIFDKDDGEYVDFEEIKENK